MATELKIQIVFAVFLALELLGLYMILIRTVVNLEYSLNRMEDIVEREVQLSTRWREHQRITREKQAQNADTRGKKNELLLNIPFMERLSKEKRKDG
jgi:hypothetical protein